VSECGLADSAKSALVAVEESRYDLAIIRCELPDGSGAELARRLSQRGGGPLPILMTENPTLEQAVEAIRCGALDIVSSAAAGNELVTAMRSAFERARGARDREARIERLTKVCRRLNQARREDPSGAIHNLRPRVRLGRLFGNPDPGHFPVLHQ